MPSGVYDRTTMTRHSWGNAWSDEQDAWLKEACKSSKSYSELAAAFNARFNDTKTRCAIMGRAVRRGYARTKPKAKGSPTISKLGSRALKTYDRKVRVQKINALAPVVFKDPAGLRDDAEPILRRSHPHMVKARPTSEQIEEARKGRRISIIEEKPLTSKPMFETSHDECKWPTSEDITCMEVCGAQATHGAYCERHALVAYREMPTKKRNGSYGKRGFVEERKRIQDEDAQWIADNVLDDLVEVVGDAPLMLPNFIKDVVVEEDDAD